MFPPGPRLEGGNRNASDVGGGRGNAKAKAKAIKPLRLVIALIAADAERKMEHNDFK